MIRHSHNPTVRHAQGSTLILVIVSLVLMTMLGVTYVHTSQLQRQVTAIQTRSSSKIESNINAVIQQIQRVLRDDLLDGNDQFFNTTAPADTTDPYDPNVGGGDEPFDYPYTSPMPTTSAQRWKAIKFDGTQVDAAGGYNDDTWLASTIPTFSGSTATWPHITNLNGLFLHNGTDGDLTTGNASPDEDAVTNSGGTTADTDVLESSAYLVDTDGDGIKDSRWTWAPISKSGNVVYVMAVRIIDNSSLINANAATAMTSNGDNGWGAFSTRGYFPNGLDLTRLLKRTTDVSSSWTTELPNLMTNIRGVSVTMPTPLDLDSFSKPVWAGGTLLYGDLTNQLALDNEQELRFRGGLSNGPKDVEVDAETQMPNLLRAAAPSELNFQDISYAGLNVGTNKFEKMMAYYQGVDPTETPKTNAAVETREFPTIRHMLTTISGSAVFAPNHDNIHSGAHTLKFDLVNEDTATPVTRVTNIANRLKNVFLITDQSTTTNAYLGLDTSNATDLDTINQMATEFALAIQDYSDSDSIPTGQTIDTVTYYGLEAMPFIREVYFQAGYDDKDNKSSYAPPIPGQDGLADTWEFHFGSQAVAVEIGNPFDQLIKAADLNSKIKIVIIQNNTVESEYVLTGASDLASRDDLASTDILVVYSNPTSPVEEYEGTQRNNLVNDLSLTGTTLNAGDGTLTFITDEDITVELQVNVSPGPDGIPGNADDWVAYDRLTVAFLQLSDKVPHYTSLTTAPFLQSHGQIAAVRDGQNIHYLSNTNKTLNERLPSTSGYSTAFTLESDNKDVTGNVALDDYQIPIANRSFYSTAELGWIHLFGFTDEPAGDFPQRFDVMSANRRFLDFSNSTVVPSSTGIPHAAMVMDQFTTLSPRNDSLDNDNDDQDNNAATGYDNIEEQFVPGTININTVPLHLATLAAPLPEGINDVQELMTAMIAYRDLPTVDSTDTPLYDDRTVRPSITNWRSEPGIASIGELMFINPTVANDQPSDIQMYSYDSVDQKNDPHDLYPLPEDVPTDALRQSAIDGPEESMARFQFLSQVFTTRSDIFTAYVLIQGFNSDNFTDGAVESARFFAIFDRSRITGPDDAVRVLGVYKIN